MCLENRFTAQFYSELHFSFLPLYKYLYLWPFASSSTIAILWCSRRWTKKNRSNKLKVDIWIIRQNLASSVTHARGGLMKALINHSSAIEIVYMENSITSMQRICEWLHVFFFLSLSLDRIAVVNVCNERRSKCEKCK